MRSRWAATVALMPLTWAFVTNGWAQGTDTDLLTVLSRYARPDGTLDVQHLQKDYVAQKKLNAQAPAQPVLPAVIAQPAPTMPRKAAPGPSPEPIEDFQFLVRENFADVWLF